MQIKDSPGNVEQKLSVYITGPHDMQRLSMSQLVGRIDLHHSHQLPFSHSRVLDKRPFFRSRGMTSQYYIHPPATGKEKKKETSCSAERGLLILRL